MNGRMAKQLRKITANPQLPEGAVYKAIEHPIIQYRILTDAKGLSKIEPYGVTRIQIELGDCQRKLYQVWKQRYLFQKRRSDTAPYRGLQQKLMR